MTNKKPILQHNINLLSTLVVALIDIRREKKNYPNANEEVDYYFGQATESILESINAIQEFIYTVYGEEYKNLLNRETLLQEPKK